MKYVVLLRGVNISGKNKISMQMLKIQLENMNYTNIKTYLNSGNITLESIKNKNEITDEIQKMIIEQFNLNIPVFVINYLDLKELVENAPNWWGTNNKETYDNIIFVIDPFKVEEVINELGSLNNKIEQKQEYKNNIFWSYDLNNYRKSNWWNKSALGDVKNKITIRTANTIKKILNIIDCNNNNDNP